MASARGEIYSVNLSPVQGREQAGTRPAATPAASEPMAHDPLRAHPSPDEWEPYDPAADEAADLFLRGAGELDAALLDDAGLEEDFPLGDGTADDSGVVYCPYCGAGHDIRYVRRQDGSALVSLEAAARRGVRPVVRRVARRRTILAVEISERLESRADTCDGDPELV